MEDHNNINDDPLAAAAAATAATTTISPARMTYRMEKHPPNQLQISSPDRQKKGSGGGGSTFGSIRGEKGTSVMVGGSSGGSKNGGAAAAGGGGGKPGWYNHDGVKTCRKRPTSDKEAKKLVHSLRSTAHQMGLLVYRDV